METEEQGGKVKSKTSDKRRQQRKKKTMVSMISTGVWSCHPFGLPLW